LYYFHKKIKKFKKPQKTILSGFFGWVFYCQPCLKASFEAISQGLATRDLSIGQELAVAAAATSALAATSVDGSGAATGGSVKKQKLKVHKHDIFFQFFCRSRNLMVPRACNARFLKIVFDSAEIFDF
jgi:hypothetical protein